MSALLSAMVSAENVLKGRELHGAKGDSLSQAFTNTFNWSPNSHGPKAEYEGEYQIGMIVGFVLLTGLMIFAVITIILDEVKRHKDFKQRVADDEYKLKTSHGCTQQDIELLREEFEQRERLRGNVKDQERARQELAEIN